MNKSALIFDPECKQYYYEVYDGLNTHSVYLSAIDARLYREREHHSNVVAWLIGGFAIILLLNAYAH